MTYILYPTGTDENDKSPLSISVFPNPSAGIFTIATKAEQKNARIEIFSILGERIYVDDFSGFSKQINLSVAPGIYIVKLNDGKELFIKKIVKE